jgi:hypothetical protein
MTQATTAGIWTLISRGRQLYALIVIWRGMWPSMINATWIEAAGTIFVGLVGLWLAHNYRRQVRLKLAERQVDSYLALWRLTASATPTRKTPLDGNECQQLYAEMSRWYYDGNGMFLSVATRNLFLGLRSNLVCPISSIKPPSLAAEMMVLPEAKAERRRGCVAIRQASLLRTQLKTDVSMHFGFAYYSDLRPDDRLFLRSCGLSTLRQPWRRQIFHPSGRAAPNPCVCGECTSFRAAPIRIQPPGQAKRVRP